MELLHFSLQYSNNQFLYDGLSVNLLEMTPQLVCINVTVTKAGKKIFIYKSEVLLYLQKYFARSRRCDIAPNFNVHNITLNHIIIKGGLNDKCVFNLLVY